MLRCLDFGKFRHFSVAPKVFNFVKLPCFRIKNMDHRVKIVHQNPFCRAGPFRMRRHGMEFFFYLFVDAFGNGFHVGIGIAFADDKKISRGFAEFPQVKLNDVFTFFITNAFDDQVIALFGLLGGDIGPPGCCQIQIV